MQLANYFLKAKYAKQFGKTKKSPFPDFLQDHWELVRTKKSPYHGDPRPRPEIRGQGRGGDSIYPIFGDRDGVGTASS